MNTLPSVRVKLSSKKLREKISKITPFRAGIAKKDCGKISKITLKSANVTHVTSADFQSKSQKKIAWKIPKMTSKSADVTLWHRRISKGYFTKYRMIHNLPIPLADFGLSPEIKFAKEIKDFKKNKNQMFYWKSFHQIQSNFFKKDRLGKKKGGGFLCQIHWKRKARLIFRNRASPHLFPLTRLKLFLFSKLLFFRFWQSKDIFQIIFKKNKFFF